MIVSCFITALIRFEDGREVDVHRTGEEIAVAIDQIADPDQVVVDITEVMFVFLAEPGQVGDTAHQARKGVALWRDGLTHANQLSLHLEDLLQLPVVGLEKNCVLEFVDPVVERGQAGEEAIDEAVDDSIQQQRWLFHRSLGFAVASPNRGKRRTVFAMDRDEEAFRVKAMHLDQPVVVGSGAVDDDEDEVVVHVDLCSLVELLRV
jgi:hypothetical protein